MTLLPIVPIAIPALAAALMLTLARGSVAGQRALSLMSSLAQGAFAVMALAAFASNAEPTFYQLSGWERHGMEALGIETTLDPLGALMLFATAAISCTAVSMYPAMMREEEPHGLHPMTQFMLMGVNLTFVTNDLFNLFVSFEIMLLASYALMGLGVTGPRTRHTMTYLCANLVASTLFLCGIGMVYSSVGVLNMTDIAARLSGAVVTPPLAKVACAMLFAGWAMKAAAVPVMGWLPEAYSALRGPLAGLFGGLLTKVGIYAILRVLWGVFGGGASEYALMGALALAAPSLLLGGLGALSRPTVRGILTMSIVAQIGYALLGIGIGSIDAISATVFFLAHTMIVKAALFHIGAAMEHVSGTPDDAVASFSGLAKSHPALACAFFVCALAMIGIPPTTGYWGKLGLARAGFAGGFGLLTALAIGCSILTALPLMRVWTQAFWSPRAEGTPALRRLPALSCAGLAGIVAVIVFMGLNPEPFLRVSRSAAERLAAYHSPILVAEAP